MTATVPHVVVGSGAAGLNCAIHLVEAGIPADNVLIVTEDLLGSTSYNAGSDKQTYYKLGIYGDVPDSPVEMAKDMIAGGAMHGTHALIEASLSVREFFHLVQLGVPFPHDKYGGYVGYTTDNDPRQRASSVGPRTSQVMVEVLLNRVEELGIPILDRCLVIKIVADGHQKRGLLGLNLYAKNMEDYLVAISANNVVLATGGPACMYRDSVYPESHWGGWGIGVEARAEFRNLTEAQFGLASTKFRWNLSGSYQQVLPCYISGKTYEDCVEGTAVEEFLIDYFPDTRVMFNAIFLKGYQWPFNADRLKNWSSSLVDMAVFHEIFTRGRVVCLDYRQNPQGFDLFHLPRFPKEYLARSNAMRGTPIGRLRALNPQAIQIFQENGIDLAREPIEISLCAQHSNGGYSVNTWWETTLSHLFAIGEAAGTHGVHRPGGAALNAGQVGGLRASQFIAKHYIATPPEALDALAGEIKEAIDFMQSLTKTPNEDTGVKLRETISKFQAEFSTCAGVTRSMGRVATLVDTIDNQINTLAVDFAGIDWSDLPLFYKFKDLLYSQWITAASIKEYLDAKGGSRGSYIVLDEGHPKAEAFHEKLPYLKMVPNLTNINERICHIYLGRKGDFHVTWFPAAPVPQVSEWFETTWQAFDRGDMYL
jgi:succinate dehydrogenase/fumarate reductase flavoprotein subunit